MGQKTTKGIETTWKSITLIGVIAGAGFAAATYLAGIQTKSEADAEHREIDERFQAVDEDLEQVDDDLEDQRYIQVRIEVAQQQLMDEARRERVANEPARTRAEREEREDELEVIDRRLLKRERALRGSYRRVPVAPSAELAPGDPLAGAKGL